MCTPFHCNHMPGWQRLSVIVLELWWKRGSFTIFFFKLVLIVCKYIVTGEFVKK